MGAELPIGLGPTYQYSFTEGDMVFKVYFVNWLSNIDDSTKRKWKNDHQVDWKLKTELAKEIFEEGSFPKDNDTWQSLAKFKENEYIKVLETRGYKYGTYCAELDDDHFFLWLDLADEE